MSKEYNKKNYDDYQSQERAKLHETVNQLQGDLNKCCELQVDVKKERKRLNDLILETEAGNSRAALFKEIASLEEGEKHRRIDQRQLEIKLADAKAALAEYDFENVQKKYEQQLDKFATLDGQFIDLKADHEAANDEVRRLANLLNDRSRQLIILQNEAANVRTKSVDLNV